ncbi:uncharacterized protein RHO25_004444 [Cercospora beticola]|uniref:Uncharacterized protein n=1 Tax=Cercospora beticola TaxID=122368 RepID=A0ABZ0NK24_CERBT|nr:hypothetical protein RHO25_004444 [Cercospora beticola]
MIGDTARAYEQLDAEKPNGASKQLSEDRTHEDIGNRCRLSELPRELRDLIYHYAAFFHIRDVGIGQTPGLLRANNQLRFEFSDTLYSSKLLKIRYFDNAVWKTSQTKCLLRALLECKDRMVVDFAGRLLGTSRDQAERLAEFNSNHIDPGAVAGFLELLGTHGRSCINVAFARSMIEAHAAESINADSAENSLKRKQRGALGSVP